MQLLQRGIPCPPGLVRRPLFRVLFHSPLFFPLATPAEVRNVLPIGLICAPPVPPIQLGCKFRGAWNHVYFAYHRKHKLTSRAMYNGYYVNQLVQAASSPMAYRRSVGRGVAWFCAAAYKLPTSNNDNGNKDSKISFSNSCIVRHWYKCFNDLILKKKIRK